MAAAFACISYFLAGMNIKVVKQLYVMICVRFNDSFKAWFTCCRNSFGIVIYSKNEAFYNNL